jgi:hypothetical protein
MGRIVRLVAATAALTFLGISGAAAGWYGSGYGYGAGCCAQPVPVNWGCGSSCAPLVMPRVYYGYSQSNCCAPVRWGCGSSCGYGYTQPVHVAYQGPTYERPLTGYTYPAYEEPVYRPYVRPYRPVYRGHRYGVYRSVVRPRVAHYDRYAPRTRFRDYAPRRRYAPIGLK